MAVRPQLDEWRVTGPLDRPTPAVRDQRPGLDELDVAAPLDDIGHDEPRLSEVGTAGRVCDDAPGPGRVERAGQQLALQCRKTGDVGRLSPPAGLWPAPQRPKTCARSVDEDSVVCVGLARADVPAVAGPDSDLSGTAARHGGGH